MKIKIIFSKNVELLFFEIKKAEIDQNMSTVCLMKLPVLSVCYVYVR